MVILSLVWSLVGCAEQNACKTYVEAASDCASSAGADASPYDVAVICGDWTETDEATYGAWYTCRADAIDAGDCGSQEGLDAALAAAETCTQP